MSFDCTNGESTTSVVNTSPLRMHCRAEERLEESERAARSAQDQQSDSERRQRAEAARLQELKAELQEQKSALQGEWDRCSV